MMQRAIEKEFHRINPRNITAVSAFITDNRTYESGVQLASDTLLAVVNAIHTVYNAATWFRYLTT